MGRGIRRGLRGRGKRWWKRFLNEEKPMMTTLERLRGRVGVEVFDTSQDELLSGFAGLVESRLEMECNRRFARLAGAMEEFRGRQLLLAVERYPIEAVTEFAVKYSERTGWEVIAIADVDYLVVAGSQIRLEYPLGTVHSLLRVTYTGGYVMPGTVATAGQAALPVELEEALLQQVAYMYQSRDKLGIITQWDAGTAYRQYQKAELLSEVAAVVQRYRRYTL
jgi:hypothetical protein